MLRGFKGFSVIEALVAAAVMGTAMTAVMGTVRVCCDASRGNLNRLRGCLKAEAVLVKQMMVGRNEYGQFEGGNGKFKWVVNVSETEIEDVGKVLVDVSWIESGKMKEFELISFMKMENSEQTTEGR
jgi:hypothetical protein